jgi:transcription antitermination protein NusB
MSGRPSAVAKNKAARLMAVQAVYQMRVNGGMAPLVVNEYLHLRKNMTVDGETMVEPDSQLFTEIVNGVQGRLPDLQPIVAANRPVKEGQIRVDEPLLEAHLLCGTYELLSHQTIDAPVIISSYVDVAKAFFAGNEPKLVNAVLDSVGKVVRS